MILSLTQSVFYGKTLVRSMMNEKFSQYALTGKTLDIGGGAHPSYLRYFKKEGTFVLSTVDLTSTEHETRLDLEKETLPYEEGDFNDVLMINFLEHIYNYQHVVQESYRVLKTGGRLIGFVPFLINVHPDPHDYFRYTSESLDRICSDAGYTKVCIDPVGYGPFAVGFNSLVSVIPGKLLFWLVPGVLLLDSLFLLIRPQWKERFPLGYLFVMKK